MRKKRLTQKTDNDIKVNGKKRSNDSVKGPSRKILCARPFAHMRGHTAFLTFATAGNKLRPDPNASLTL